MLSIYYFYPCFPCSSSLKGKKRNKKNTGAKNNGAVSRFFFLFFFFFLRYWKKKDGRCFEGRSDYGRQKICCLCLTQGGQSHFEMDSGAKGPFILASLLFSFFFFFFWPDKFFTISLYCLFFVVFCCLCRLTLVLQYQAFLCHLPWHEKHLGITLSTPLLSVDVDVDVVVCCEKGLTFACNFCIHWWISTKLES